MNPKQKRYNERIIENRFFSKMLDNLNIHKNYTGYFFMLDILDILINQKMQVKSFSRQVYPIIAKKYSKSECAIERNIRSLIDKCWNGFLQQKLNVTTNKKPTCCEFIKLVKNYIYKQII